MNAVVRAADSPMPISCARLPGQRSRPRHVSGAPNRGATAAHGATPTRRPAGRGGAKGRTKDEAEACERRELSRERGALLGRSSAHDVDKAEALALMDEHDVVGSGYIGYDEFLDIMARRIAERSPEEELRKAFELFDEDAGNLREPGRLECRAQLIHLCRAMGARGGILGVGRRACFVSQRPSTIRKPRQAYLRALLSLLAPEARDDLADCASACEGLTDFVTPHGRSAGALLHGAVQRCTASSGLPAELLMQVDQSRWKLPDPRSGYIGGTESRAAACIPSWDCLELHASATRQAQDSTV